MKSTVKLSAYSATATILSLFVLVALSVYGYRGGMPQWLALLIGGIIIAMTVLGLIYMPVAISVNDKYLQVIRPIFRKTIPLSEISSVRLCHPTMSERRILGSGGFMGYWGRFSEPSIGKYFAYYGKASDCFLVTMKNGRKYLLGCVNPTDIVSYIQSKI